MSESNLIFQTADHELGNFVMINKEILMATDENGNPLMSMESKGLFLTLMGLQGTNWNLTISGLAKITGWTKDTVTKYLNDDREKIKIIIENLSSNFVYDLSFFNDSFL